MIFNRFGLMYWNPGIARRRGWKRTYEWKPAPGLKWWCGPLVFETRRSGGMTRYREIEVDVRYRFSAAEPCVIIHWARVLIWLKGQFHWQGPVFNVAAGSVCFGRKAWLLFLLAEDPQQRPERLLMPLWEVA